MLNCSQKCEYDARIAELEAALYNRNYPRGSFSSRGYDASARSAALRRIMQRNRNSITATNDHASDNVIVFKTPYSSLFGKLKVARKFDKLKRDASIYMGKTLLPSTRFIIAHTAGSCLFRDTSLISVFKSYTFVKKGGKVGFFY